MSVEEKIALAEDIIKRLGCEENREVVLSIADGIKNDRYFYEMNEGKIVLFLTWLDQIIDGKRYIFTNNLWIEPEYRGSNTLVRVRTALKYLLGDVYTFYWFNKKKKELIYRR